MKKDNYQGPWPLKEIENNTDILVNADYLDFSILFTLSVDSIERRLIVKLTELPELGVNIITHEEIDGIIIDY